MTDTGGLALDRPITKAPGVYALAVDGAAVHDRHRAELAAIRVDQILRYVMDAGGRPGE